MESGEIGLRELLEIQVDWQSVVSGEWAADVQEEI